jgi:hypothetical protein
MPTYQLAQLNIARPVAPLDDPVMAGFMGGLKELNALADRSPGFVWRLVDSGGQDATGLRLSDSDTMVNLSVWESVEALRDYVYRSGHLDSLRRRREWFHHDRLDAYLVLWWVPAGYLPTLADGAERLARLAAVGPGTAAFTFREPFPPPADAAAGGAPAGLAGPGLRGSQAHSSPQAGLAGPGLRGSQAHSSPQAGLAGPGLRGSQSPRPAGPR